MKKYLVAIVIIIVGVIVAITIVHFNNSNELHSTTTTEHTTNKAETPIKESATPLTEEEIEKFFLEAHKLFVEWSSPVAKYLDADWDKTTTIDGVEYFEVLPNEINSVDELKKEYEKYFSEEIIEENIDKYYVMHNGKMYGNAVLVEGGDFPYDGYQLTIKTNTSTECTFTVKSIIDNSYNKLDYTLKVIDGKWKFVEVFNWVTMDENIAFHKNQKPTA